MTNNDLCNGGAAARRVCEIEGRADTDPLWRQRVHRLVKMNKLHHLAASDSSVVVCQRQHQRLRHALVEKRESKLRKAMTWGGGTGTDLRNTLDTKTADDASNTR